jgi:hypothetical protein
MFTSDIYGSGEEDFKDKATFQVFTLPIRKIFGIPESCKQNLKRHTQGTSLQK